MMSAAVHTLCSASQLAVLVKLALRRKRDARGRAAMSSHVGACMPGMLHSLRELPMQVVRCPHDDT